MESTQLSAGEYSVDIPPIKSRVFFENLACRGKVLISQISLPATRLQDIICPKESMETASPGGAFSIFKKTLAQGDALKYPVTCSGRLTDEGLRVNFLAGMMQPLFFQINLPSDKPWVEVGCIVIGRDYQRQMFLDPRNISLRDSGGVTVISIEGPCAIATLEMGRIVMASCPIPGVNENPPISLSVSHYPH